jgi:hypothetical protein
MIQVVISLLVACVPLARASFNLEVLEVLVDGGLCFAGHFLPRRTLDYVIEKVEKERVWTGHESRRNWPRKEHKVPERQSFGTLTRRRWGLLGFLEWPSAPPEPNAVFSLAFVWVLLALLSPML